MPACLFERRSTIRSFRISTVIALGLGLVACGGSDDHPSTAQSSPLENYGIAIAGCERYSYVGCEITEASCQQAVFDLVKCVRKTPNGTLPPVTTMTAAEYRDKLTQSQADANPTDLQKQENALVMLGLAAPGDLTVSNQVDVLVNTVGAYYTSEEKKVYVIRPDTAPSTAELNTQTLTLAHEFVHALQDENYDLTQFEKDNCKTYDSTLATSAVVEGEAILYESMLRAAFDGLEPEQVDLASRFASGAEFIQKTYSSDAPILIAPRMFPYFYGGPYVHLELAAQGRSGVDGLFASPPPATLPFIVSQGSLVDTQLNPVTEAGPTPVAGSALLYEDTLGAWMTYEYLNRISGNVLTPAPAVSGWRGDHAWIYSDADTTVAANIAVVWRVRFASQDDVTTFVNRTNTAAVGAPAGATASRRAFIVNGDAVVVAVTGKFDLSVWQSAVTAAASAAAAPSTAGAGGAAAPSPSLRRAIVTPVPRRTP